MAQAGSGAIQLHDNRWPLCGPLAVETHFNCVSSTRRTSGMHVKSRTVCYAAPRAGIVAYENEYYARATGTEKRRIRYLEIGDDIYDHGEYAVSHDNGI